MPRRARTDPTDRADRAGTAAVEAASHLRRSPRWNGLRAGDPVVVSGLRARGMAWEFRAHVVNEHNGDESIEVVGGRPGDRTVRSFDPHRIFAVTGRRAGPRGGAARSAASGQGLSLADAPQLPLD